MAQSNTYQAAIPIQHLQYLPFGEQFIDQRNTSYNTPYKFSGKEKDLETDYGYFGARYYHSDISIWLSVDPLADKEPSWSPYRAFYCNPIKFIDPTGLWEKDADGNWVAQKGDSWWTLHKQSGMSWDATMSFAKNYNAARGQSNWKFVGVGDKVNLSVSSQKSATSSTNNYSFKSTSATSSTNISLQNDNEQNFEKRGSIISAGNVTAAIGPLGIMADFGAVIDSKNNSKLYFTVGWVQGLGLSAGAGYSWTNKGFKIDDYKGKASGWQVSTPWFIGYENAQDMQSGAEKTYYGSNARINGINMGVGVGVFHYFGHTFVFDPPPIEYFTNPTLWK